MGGEFPHTSLKFAHPPQPRKISPLVDSPLVDCPHQIFIPPPPLAPATKQQFSSYNPIKTAFLTVVIALAPFLF